MITPQHQELEKIPHADINENPLPKKQMQPSNATTSHPISMRAWSILTVGIAFGDTGFTFLAFSLWNTLPNALVVVMSLVLGAMGVLLGHETGHAIHERRPVRARAYGFCALIYCAMLGTARYNYMYLQKSDALLGNLVSSYGFIFVLVAASAILGIQREYFTKEEQAAKKQAKDEHARELERIAALAAADATAKAADASVMATEAAVKAAAKAAENAEKYTAKATEDAEKAAAKAADNAVKVAVMAADNAVKAAAKAAENAAKSAESVVESAFDRIAEIQSRITEKSHTLIIRMNEDVMKSADAQMDAYEFGFYLFRSRPDRQMKKSSIIIPLESNLGPNSSASWRNPR